MKIKISISAPVKKGKIAYLVYRDTSKYLPNPHGSEVVFVAKPIPYTSGSEKAAEFFKGKIKGKYVSHKTIE